MIIIDEFRDISVTVAATRSVCSYILFLNDKLKKKKKNSRKLKREKKEKLSLRGKRSRTRSLLSLSGRTQIGAAHGETAEKDLLTGKLKHRKKAEKNINKM